MLHPTKKEKSSSILTKRLTDEVTKQYLRVFLIVLGLFLLTIIPILTYQQLKKCKEYSNYIASQYEQALDNATTEMLSLESNDSLKSSLAAYLSDPNDSTSARIELYLQTFLTSYPNIQYCLVELPDSTVFQSFSNSSTEAMQCCLNDEGYQNMKASGYSGYYSKLQKEDLFYVSDNSYYGHTFFYTKKVTINSYPCYYTIFYGINSAINTSKSLSNGIISDYYIFNRSNNYIYSSSSNDIEVLPENIDFDLEKSTETQVKLKGVFNYVQILSYGWTVVSYTSWALLFSSTYLILFIMIFFFVLPLVFFRRIIVPLNTCYLQPLSTLTEQMSNYSVGQSLETNIRTGDEIEILSRAFDKMIVNINSQIEEIKKQERENCETHYSLLATQVDPHFIYNTLNIINVIARQHNETDIVEINTALAKILRERFSVNSSIFDTLENELDTIKQYCVIMRYRYQNFVKVDIQAETSLLLVQVPKNLLIPIIENSFYHGMSVNDTVIKGHIDIAIYQSDKSSVTFEVSDDGVGISEEQLEQLRENSYQTSETDRTHIGLANVYERLKYLYQDSFSFDIFSNGEGSGTTCIITIPVLSNSNPIEEKK